MRDGARAAVVAAWLLSAWPAEAATVEGTVTIDGRPGANAVVYLESPNAAPPVAPPARAVMDQKNLTFVPGVLPVVRGTAVEFTNSDDVQHNVFSPSAIAGKFDLGTYGPGATRSVVLGEPGDVRVLCNIHMEMEAHILVLDTPYFSRTEEDGSYRILEVPEGAYTVKIWHRRWLPFRRTIDVPAGGRFALDVAAGE